jgi:anti-sigma factor RsiW
MIARLLMGSCAETAARMSDHADGELRGLRRLRVAGHLARCERCRAIYEALVATIAGLRSLGAEQPEARPDLALDVVARIRREGGGRSP